MSFTVLAAGLAGALATKFAEKIVEKSAEKTFDNRSAILEKVRGLLVGEEVTTLNLLEKYPKNEDMQKEVAEKLAPRLAANQTVAKELDELLKQLPTVEIKQNTLNQTGNNNKAAQDIHNSTINIS